MCDSDSVVDDVFREFRIGFLEFVYLLLLLGLGVYDGGEASGVVCKGGGVVAYGFCMFCVVSLCHVDLFLDRGE